MLFLAACGAERGPETTQSDIEHSAAQRAVDVHSGLLLGNMDTDPHSPRQYRVNGVVRNIPEFYEVFELTKTDALYLAPEERVKIW